MSSSEGDLPYVEDEYMERKHGGDNPQFKQPSLAEALDIERRARRAAGLTQGADRTSRGRPARMEQTLAALKEGITQLGMHGGSEFTRITDILKTVTGSIEERKSEIKELSELLDSNKDGVVSDLEVRKASTNEAILNSVNKIHPLLARSLKDPSFRIRQIKKQEVSATAQYRQPSNQVNLVRQGYGGYMEDLNKFNVDFG